MKIETKYDVGQQIYYVCEIKEWAHPDSCPACGGSYRVTINGQEYDCPAEGDWVPSQGVRGASIVSVIVTHHNTVYHTMDDGAVRVPESDIFPTIAEAQAECDRRNGEKSDEQTN